MLLKVNKKVASEAEARDILKASMALEKPFGIPTICFYPQDLAPEREAEQKRKVKGRLSQTFNRLSIGDFRARRRLYKDYKKTAAEWREELAEGEVLNEAWTIRRHPYTRNADYYRVDPKSYKDPLGSLVLVSPDPAKDLIEKNYGKRNFPGTKTDVALIVLWHELAHGAGAGEPQADKMAGLVFRQLVTDQSFLRSWTDMRAIEAILGYKNKAIAENYGWGIVEAGDQVWKMPQAEIDKMTEEDIKKVRFEAFENKADTIRFVGKFWEEYCLQGKKGGDSLQTHFFKAMKDFSSDWERQKQAVDMFNRFLKSIKRLPKVENSPG